MANPVQQPAARHRERTTFTPSPARTAAMRTHYARSFPVGFIPANVRIWVRGAIIVEISTLASMAMDAANPITARCAAFKPANGNFPGFYYDVYGHIIGSLHRGRTTVAIRVYDKIRGPRDRDPSPTCRSTRYEYQHASSVTNSVTNLYSMHLLVQELQPDGRVLKNILRLATSRHESVGHRRGDLNLVRNATFALHQQLQSELTHQSADGVPRFTITPLIR